MNNPLFSVLIANSNYGNYIADSINSVINQSYSNWEIIIVDDNSSDNSYQVIKSFINKGININFKKNDCHQGCGFTKNLCVKMAKGEICAFLDSDDTLEKNALELLVKHHIQNLKHALIYSYPIKMCDKDLVFKEYSVLSGKMPENVNQLTAESGQKISHFASFKKYFYDKTEGINPQLKRAVDQDLYYKIEEQGPVLSIESSLYNYRLHHNNISLNENNVKAWYWLYVTNRSAYNRRKKLKTLNTTYSEVQRLYLKVCLLKIDQKIRTKNHKNILYYYYQAILRIIFDKELIFIKVHWFFTKRLILIFLNKKQNEKLYLK
jgi:glycosyltransferase involved in cell wall biosynthesis